MDRYIVTLQSSSLSISCNFIEFGLIYTRFCCGEFVVCSILNDYIKMIEKEFVDYDDFNISVFNYIPIYEKS